MKRIKDALSSQLKNFRIGDDTRPIIRDLSKVPSNISQKLSGPFVFPKLEQVFPNGRVKIFSKPVEILYKHEIICLLQVYRQSLRDAQTLVDKSFLFADFLDAEAVSLFTHELPYEYAMVLLYGPDFWQEFPQLWSTPNKLEKKCKNADLLYWEMFYKVSHPNSFHHVRKEYSIDSQSVTTISKEDDMMLYYGTSLEESHRFLNPAAPLQTDNSLQFDFSPKDNPGMYVTGDLSLAIACAKNLVTRRLLYSQKQHTPVVLSFKISKAEFLKQQFKVKTFLKKDKKEWGQTVKAARMGALAHSFDVVEGNVLANPDKTILKRPRLIGFGHQMALFSPRAIAWLQAQQMSLNTVEELETGILAVTNAEQIVTLPVKS